MSNPKADPRSTRDRILDAALNIFSAKGFHDTKLDEIVAEGGISKGSIYFHFPNKEKLFIALVDQFADVIERAPAKQLTMKRPASPASRSPSSRSSRPSADTGGRPSCSWCKLWAWARSSSASAWKSPTDSPS